MGRQHPRELGGAIRPSKTPGWGGVSTWGIQRAVLYLSDALDIGARAPVYPSVIFMFIFMFWPMLDSGKQLNWN